MKYATSGPTFAQTLTVAIAWPKKKKDRDVGDVLWYISCNNIYLFFQWLESSSLCLRCLSQFSHCPWFLQSENVWGLGLQHPTQISAHRDLENKILKNKNIFWFSTYQYVFSVAQWLSPQLSMFSLEILRSCPGSPSCAGPRWSPWTTSSLRTDTSPGSSSGP